MLIGDLRRRVFFSFLFLVRGGMLIRRNIVNKLELVLELGKECCNVYG
jgi:hypothetical protein